MDENRIADYFIISGVPEDAEQSTESKPLINPTLPITDITVIFKSLGEQCPTGYTCIEFTPNGYIADLNNGNFKSLNIHICYRRGNDKPPLVEVGVYHQGQERPLPDVEVVHETPYGRSASTGNTSTKWGTFITYRRAKTKNPYNQLVVVDLCVILNNKSEHPPHAFYSIRKNLNKSYYGMIGSEVFLCYKKTLLAPPSICYTPQIISRFPLQDLENFPLPDTVPLFCLPAGATIEMLPANITLPRPVKSTFVLTSNSAQKIYGCALSFYELYDGNLLSQEQKARLKSCHTAGKSESENCDQYETFAIKSICILSRWPFFECFDKFLHFLYKLVFSSYSSQNSSSPVHRSKIPLEHHISHFLLDVSFPTPQRPTVVVQLMPGTDEIITISQPSSRLPLPLTGASFIHLLTTLGVENTINVLLFCLCEQKILLHSLNPYMLTTVAEAITAMLFPFHWQCPYVPLCPMSLHGILNAPLPFIVGIDSRYFDTLTPPEDVICVDLDTKSIFLSEIKKCLNIRILPKRASRMLRHSLEQIFQKWERVGQAIGANQSPQHQTPAMEESKQQLKRKFELEIREAFVRFMATILRGFRTYLLPIMRAPTVGATDPSSLFDFEGFLMSRERSHSQFYQLITKTQMFTHYIEERSFVSDKDTSLAFFDDCEERLTLAEDVSSGKPIKLFDKDDDFIRTDRSVYVPAPEQSPSVSHSNSVAIEDHNHMASWRMKFGPLNPALFHRHPQSNFPSLDKALKFNRLDKHKPSIFAEANSNALSNSYSISRRTKQEVEASRKAAKKSVRDPQEWSRYLVSCCYCLWFSLLPSYISYSKDLNPSNEEEDDGVSEDDGGQQEVKTVSDKSTARTLRHAYSAIVRMQRLQLTTDEVCFRILTLLCGHYGQPALAVRVFFEMRKAGIKPNAVTYGYYNSALLESRWPDHSGKPTTVLWTKVRNVIMGVALFKLHGRIRICRRDRSMMPLLGEMSFDVNPTSIRAMIGGDLFRPTTTPISQRVGDSSLEVPHRDSQHRRSLVNRSFSTYQKNTMDIVGKSELDYEDDLEHAPRCSLRKSHSMHAESQSPRLGLASRSSSFDDDAEGHRFGTEVMDGKATKQQAHISTGSNSGRHANHVKDLQHQPSGVCDEGLLIALDTEVRENPQKAEKLDKSHHDDTTRPQPNFTRSVDSLPTDDGSSGDARSNRLSESTTDASTRNPSNDIEFSSMDAFETPNFKLSSLINDASNLQWSKWTASQNSKSVYKGIKSVATGLVSSLREIETSFSMSESATPSKLINTVQHKSNNTREMLSQWATQWGHLLSQKGVREDEIDSDEESIASEDLLHLGAEDDENVDESPLETNDFQFCHRQLIESERQFNMSSCKEEYVNHLYEIPEADRDRVAMVIKMTTCSRCSSCQSMLNDDEIMGRWSYNESNLNTKCVYCRAKIVPMMTVEVEDLRLLASSEVEEVLSQVATNLNSMKLDEKESTSRTKGQNLLDIDEQVASEKEESNPESTLRTKSSFTIPYLSPIVLRKEIESVFESAGDNCPASSRFIDEHPIIFWNLLWYFNRIGIPTHLALLCLSSKSISNGCEVPADISSRDKVVVHILCDIE